MSATFRALYTVVSNARARSIASYALFLMLLPLISIPPIALAGAWISRALDAQTQETQNNHCQIQLLKIPAEPRRCRSRETLALKQSVSRKLAKGDLAHQEEADCYAFDLKEKRVIRLEVMQEGTDVVLALYGPNAAHPDKQNFLTRLDRSNVSRGLEALTWVAEREGTYELQIVPQMSVVNEAGGYTVTLEAIEDVPTLADYERIKAETAVSQAEVRRARKASCELDEALRLFRQASEIWTKLEDQYERAWALYGVGLVYRSQGRDADALKTFSEMLALVEGFDRHGEAAALTAMASDYLTLNDPQKAYELAEKALPIRAVIGSDYGRALTLNILATAQSDLERYDEAERTFKQALDLRRSVEHKVGEAITLNGLGNLYMRMEDWEKALGYLRDALDILLNPATGDEEAKANALSDLGECYAGQKSPDHLAAITYLREAIKVADNVGSKAILATSLYRLARVEAHKQDLPAARDHVAKALEIVESLSPSSTQIDRRLKARYQASVRDFYIFNIELLMQLSDPWSAFQVSERMHARELLEMLGKANLEICQENKWSLLSWRPNAAATSFAVAPPRGQMAKSARAYEAASSRETAVPKYVVARNTMRTAGKAATIGPETQCDTASLKTRALNLAEVQGLLDEQTLLLEYVLGNEQSYLWAVSKRDRRYFVIPASRGQLAKETDRLIEMMTTGGGLIQRFEKRAIALGSQLIPAEALAATTPYRRLLIVADDELHNLPFAVLSTAATYEPLIAKYEITNLPSVKQLAVIRQRHSNQVSLDTARRLIVFGEDNLGSGTGTPTKQDGTIDSEPPEHTAQVKNEVRLQQHLNEPRLLPSFTTLKQPANLTDANKDDDIDLVLRNTAFVYDNALALLAFLADRGNADSLRRARLIGDALVYAAQHDRFLNNGSLRSSYAAGDISLPPGWRPNGRAGTIPMRGVYETQEASTVDVGNNAWAMIALLALYQHTGNQCYLDTARKLGNVIHTYRHDSGKCQGFLGGTENVEALVPESPVLRGYARAEHSIDIYAACSAMYQLTGEAQWQADAEHARLFVEKMWDEAKDCCWSGTVDDGEIYPPPKFGNMFLVPVDVQAWSVMSLPDALKAHPQVLECAERNHRNQQGGFSGYDFNDDKDGVWFEGTAQMAVAYELAGKTAPTSFILPRPADFVSDGKWVPAVFTQEQINSSDQVVAPEPQEERWARLNGARREAELLKSLFPEARIQIAKKLDFKQVAEAARQYRYVHFATHVTSADAYKLSLAGKTEKNLAETRRDGILSLEEIFKLDLSADLVVLSACETGLGYQPRGDRLEGVISGFINAGAKRVLPSLWPVPQEAVNELLGSFYRSLRKGQSPAAALRAAQLNMWRSRQWTPSDWASFQLYGDW